MKPECSHIHRNIVPVGLTLNTWECLDCGYVHDYSKDPRFAERYKNQVLPKSKS